MQRWAGNTSPPACKMEGGREEGEEGEGGREGGKEEMSNMHYYNYSMQEYLKLHVYIPLGHFSIKGLT